QLWNGNELIPIGERFVGDYYEAPAFVNDFDQVVFTRYNEKLVDGGLIEGGDRALFWQNGRETELTSLVDPGAGMKVVHVAGLNNAGQVLATCAPTTLPLNCLVELNGCVDIDGNGTSDNDGDGLCDNWETDGIDF